MKITTMQRKQERGLAKILLSGITTTLLVLIISLGILSLIISNGIMPEENVKFITPITHFVSIIAGGLVANFHVTGKRIVYCSILAGVYIIILTSLNIIMFEGEFTTFIPATIAVVLGVLISSLTKRRNTLSSRFRSI